MLELDTAILNKLIDKIVVHHKKKTADGHMLDSRFRLHITSGTYPL